MKRKQRNINFLVYLFFSCALFLPPPRGATPARARASDTMTKFDSVSISHRRGRKVGDDHLGAQLKNGLLLIDLAKPEPERIVKKIAISVAD